MLRPTISRPVCLRIRHPSGAYDQIFTTVRQLRACWCGALNMTRGRVCRLQLQLVLASAVILGSESLGTRDHILLSQIRDFLFPRLLRLADSFFIESFILLSEPALCEPNSDHRLQEFQYCVFVSVALGTMYLRQRFDSCLRCREMCFNNFVV
jgi:hypothetical protein